MSCMEALYLAAHPLVIGVCTILQFAHLCETVYKTNLNKVLRIAKVQGLRFINRKEQVACR